MKKMIQTVLVAGYFLLSACSAPKSMAQTSVSASITYQTFYDELSPYGTWIDYPSYGHVWHPTIAGDFRPYLTNGYWDYSAQGWLWMSDYAWGWAPFHYGRWIYDDLYGWLWIPGYEWSPAWVTWGSFDGYYAWAPLMPEVYVGLQFGHWRPAAFYWNACTRDHIYDRHINLQVVSRDVVNNNITHINIINNFSTTKEHNQYYARGPQVEDVQKYVSRKIDPVSMKEVNRSTDMARHNNEVRIYKPAITQPQPHEYRRMNQESNPVRNENDHINTMREQQSQNIDRLPRMKTPDRTGRPEGSGVRAGVRGHRS